MDFWLWIIIAIGTYCIGYHNGHESGFISGIHWNEVEYNTEELGDDE